MAIQTPKHSDTYVYKRLLQYVAKYWFVILIAFIGNAINAISNPLAAKWTGWFVDVYKDFDQLQHLSYYGIPISHAVPLAIVGVYLIRGIGTFLSDYYMAVAARNVVSDLSCQIFEKILMLPIKYFDKNSGGHIMSKITYNVGQISSAGAKSVEIVVREVLTVIALLGGMLLLNWKLTTLFLICVPVCALVIRVTSKLLARYSRRIQSSTGDVTQVLSESIGGQRVVKTFNGSDYEKERYFKLNFYNVSQGLKLARVTALSSPVIQMITAISLAFVVWMLLNFFDPMTPGQIIEFLTSAGLLSKPLRHLVEVTGSIQKGLVAAHDIFEFLDEEVEQDAGTYQPEHIEGRVEFKNVSFSYTGDTADNVLTQLNFTAPPGKTVAIVGRSGGGKSTIVNLIPRFYETDEGEILIDGISIKDYQLNSLRNHIALVTQHVTLFNDTIANNIAYGALRNSSREQIEDAATKAHAIEFIRELPQGFDTLVGDNGVLLSGGQRQRLAIARAILKNARILILDEATSALDNESEYFIQEALNEVMKGRTTFVIAHRLSTIEKADIILVVNQGRIVESGNHFELINRGGLYSQLHRMQFKDDAPLEV